MLLRNNNPDAATNSEDGYLLLTVLVMIFLLLLVLSVAAPRVAKQIQRDKEQEAVERGLQYRRAIQLYYKKFGAYPTDIKQLENSNQIRFLRKRYTDPMTGKDDWRLIHMGEAKVPPMGFFGQPLQGGSSSVSPGPGLGIYAPSATGTGGDTTGAGASNGSPNGTANGAANNSSTGSSNGSSTFGFSNSGSSGGFGSSNSGFGNSTPGSTNGGFGSSTSGGIGASPTGTNGPGASSVTGGTTFGSAGPIVGVGIPIKKNSLIEYHKQKRYSDWEFVYDPQQDMAMNSGGSITNGGNVNGASSNSNPAGTGVQGSGTSGSTGSFGFNNGNSGGSSGTGFGNFGGSGNSGTGLGGGSNPPSNPPQ